jgi:hypothetical protein
MPVWVGEPEQLTVTHASQICLGAQDYEVHVAQQGGAPANGATVHLSMDTVVGETGTTNTQGVATIRIEPSQPGDIEIVVTRPNTIPYLGKTIVGRPLALCPTPSWLRLRPGPFHVRVQVSSDGAAVSDATVVFSSPTPWGTTLRTSADGTVELTVDPDALLTGAPPTTASADGGFLLVLGWLDIVARKPLYDACNVRVPVGIFIPQVDEWVRPTLEGLLDHLHWPEAAFDDLPDELQVDPIAKFLIRSIALVLDAIATAMTPPGHLR